MLARWRWPRFTNKSPQSPVRRTDLTWHLLWQKWPRHKIRVNARKLAQKAPSWNREVKMPSINPRIGLYQPYPHTFGGLQAVVLKLARALPDFGFEPIIVSPEEGKFTEAIRSENLRCMIS